MRCAARGRDFVRRRVLPLAAAALVSCNGADGAQPQGFGADTTGGAGGSAAHVTTLGDSGPGTLREAVSAGHRHVVFDVAGTIVLSKPIKVRDSFVTIDGSGAPSPGITLKGAGLILSEVHDVIVRGIRIRDPSSDGITIRDGSWRIFVDHVSIDGCGDGNVDVTHGSHDVTVSWSVLSGCAKNMLVKYGTSRVSIHHNAFVHSQWRNPWLNHVDDGTAAPDTTGDVRNNLVFGWGDSGGGTGAECGAKVNLVANYYSSPNTPPERQQKAFVFPGCDRGEGARVYTAGNASGDGLPFDLNGLGNAPASFRASEVETEDACTGARQVLASAGASPRDGVDQQHLGGIQLPCD